MVKVTQANTTHESILVTTLINTRQAHLEADSLGQQQDAMPEGQPTAIAKIDQTIEQFQTYALKHSALKSSQLYVTSTK